MASVIGAPRVDDRQSDTLVIPETGFVVDWQMPVPAAPAVVDLRPADEYLAAVSS